MRDWRGCVGNDLTDRNYLARATCSRRPESYDFGTMPTMRRAGAQTRTDITDGLGKPWLFRQKDIRRFWSEPALQKK